MNPVIAITHAAFDERRQRLLERLVSQLRVEAPDIDFEITPDADRNGSLWCWRVAMLGVLCRQPSHIIWLPDDAIVCRDFGRLIRACIEARPYDVFDCFVNHSDAEALPTQWYTTPDGGYVGMGGVMPRSLLEEHLAWRDRVELRDTYSNDGGVNLWAMATGRRIYKTSRTLVQHDVTVPSIDGNDDHGFRQGLRWVDDEREGIMLEVGNFLGRTYAAPEEHLPGARTSVTELGRTYTGNHWAMVKELPPSEWRLDDMYRIDRQGELVSETRIVAIITPTYRELYSIVSSTEPSRQAVEADLHDYWIGTARITVKDDALVARMRQRAVHAFLCSSATHMLFWDADIECLTPMCVREMLMREKGVIAGACPFKQEGGRVVCNLRPKDIESGELEVIGGCLPVQDAGTGFMLVSREALYRLMRAHPELLHESKNLADYGAPMWALFDTAVIDGVYQSEDYYFCRLWQQLGETVYVYVPAKFKHYGIHGFSGSLEEQWGLAKTG